MRLHHPYHLVDPSPWPLCLGAGVLGAAVGTVLWLHAGVKSLLLISSILTGAAVSLWLRDVVREATFLGKHTRPVQAGLRLGFALFIASEVFLFVSFFWAFFHFALSPAVEIGAQWPPRGATPLDPLALPLLNTALLLSSGASVTWAHHAVLAGLRRSALAGALLTILLGGAFLACQALEYRVAPFSIADSAFGSVFFLTTGFHGFHVLAGAAFLAAAAERLRRGHFSRTRHLGLEVGAWYWHFVDVVWLFVYSFLYWWGG